MIAAGRVSHFFDGRKSFEQAGGKDRGSGEEGGDSLKVRLGWKVPVWREGVLGGEVSGEGLKEFDQEILADPL